MIALTEAKYQSKAGSTKDTPYLALTLCEYFWENWPRYNGAALYMARYYFRCTILVYPCEQWRRVLDVSYLVGFVSSVPCKVWGEITYPFINFNGCTVEV